MAIPLCICQYILAMSGMQAYIEVAMSNQQTEVINHLKVARGLEQNVHIRNLIGGVIERIRLPMSKILSLVPGESAAARARTLGISRQTYYVWLREQTRPLGDQAVLVERITGIPANLVSGRVYEESANELGGENAPPTAQMAEDGEGLPRGRTGVSEPDPSRDEPKRAARRRAGSGSQPRLGGSHGEVRRRSRRRSKRDESDELAAGD